MKAVVVNEFGDRHQLRAAELPDPAAGPGQVRIAVHAAGVNPVDTGNRQDGSWAGLSAPCVLGYDVAGVIDQVGPGTTDLSCGDRVMAMTRFRDGAGGYAELAVVDAEQVARLHAGTSFIDAAATPLAAGTALTILGRLRLEPQQRILVLGASGGVGMFLLQLAAANGLEAIAVGRRAMHAQMRTLGATTCIDYTVENVARRATELAGGTVDAIADLVGGRMLAETLEALRRGGQIATIATPNLDLGPVLDNNLTLHGVLVDNDGARTRRLADLLGDDSLRAVVSHVLPLSAAARAHEILEGGHAGGKVVLQVRD
jgi:NADPH2:quinone reductase